MRSLENRDDIEKIETMLFEIRAPFSFVPFKAHHQHYVHNMCSLSSLSGRRTEALWSFCPMFGFSIGAQTLVDAGGDLYRLDNM